VNHTTHQALIIIDMQRGMADRMAAAVVGVLGLGLLVATLRDTRA